MENVKRIRESNFEALRILCIYGIIIHHLIINAIDVAGYNKPFEATFINDLSLYINTLFIGGVNCFILISGWFGIHLTKRTIIRLIVDCVIFGLLGVIIVAWITEDVTMFHLSNLWQNCKFTHYWYITHYLILCLLSPILERSLQDIDKNTLLNWLIILMIVSIYFGYGLGYVNQDGYNYINFVFLYYIGRYLRISQQDKWYEFVGKKAILWEMGIAFIMVVLYVVVSQYKWVHGIKFWSYNTPWVLVNSILVFIWFSRLKIKSIHINTFASGVLGIYLLQGVGSFCPLRNQYAKYFYDIWGLGGVIIYALILMSVFGIIAINTNKVLRILYSKIK